MVQRCGISEGFDAEPPGPFIFGEAAPYAVGLAGSECVVEAGIGRGALAADLFGYRDPVLAGPRARPRTWR